MRIRSLTTGAALPQDEAARASLIAHIGDFASAGRSALEEAGFAVQTVRLSTQPLEQWVSADDALDVAMAVSEQCASAGIDYCSLGTVQAQIEANRERTLPLIDTLAE